MARKTTSSRTTKSAATKKKATTSSARAKPTAARKAATKKTPQAKSAAARTPRKRSTATKRAAAKPTAATAAATVVQAPANELDVLASIEELNVQLGSAVEAMAELAAAHAQPCENTVQTLPTDRAAATFQRLVSEAVDDRVGQLLPPLISLRNELAQRADAGDASGGGLAERGQQTLDHVLSLANVTTYAARIGEPHDPLIHMAVDEVAVDGMAPGMVAEALQSGFRSARGKVLVAAKVKVSGG